MRYGRSTLMIMVLCFALCAGCGGGGGGGSAGPTTGRLRVTVTRAGSGAPVAGATVRVADQAATTGGDGSCELAGVPAGSAAVAVTKGGFASGGGAATVAGGTTAAFAATLAPLVAPASYDVIVYGAGTGGFAAALQAARMGMQVALVEPTDWIGGQMTAAAVTSLDEGADLPRLRSGIYREFVDKVTAYYWNRAKSTGTAYFNPAMIAFEPSVGQRKLYELVRETEERGVGTAPLLDLYLATEVTGVLKQGSRLEGVQLQDGTQMRAKVVIEASEYGDLLPLAGARYRVGNGTSDSVNLSSCTQFITYTAVIRKYLQGMDPLLRMEYPPPGYQQMAAVFPTLIVNGGNMESRIPVDFVYHNGWRGMPDSANPADYTVSPESMRLITRTGVNWFNDFAVTAEYVENRGVRRALNCQAKLRTLQLLYYLQHDLGERDWSVADDEGFASAYNVEANSCSEIPPELKPLERQMPVKPYVREARRAIGILTLKAADIKRDGTPRVARRSFPSALAIGDYPVDLHGCSQAGDLDCGETPQEIPPWGGGVFQVPFEVFVPEAVDGLVLAEKNLSVSRLVNGAIRLQPVTMMTGQAAGALAAVAVRRGVQPREVRPIEVQWELLEAGGLLSLHHPADVPVTHPLWKQVQLALLYGLVPPSAADFDPGRSVTRAELAGVVNNAFGTAVTAGGDAVATRADLALLMVSALGLDPAGAPAAPLYSDLPAAHPAFREVQLLSQQGLLQGLGGAERFLPEQPVTRGEALLVVVDAALGSGSSALHRLPLVTTGAQSPTGSILINAGSELTNALGATLSLHAVNAGGAVTGMQFRKGSGNWYGWEPYATTRQVTLPAGDGEKSVSVRFRDASGNVSEVYTDSIVLDTTPPTGSVVINGGVESTGSTAVTLSITASDLNGVERMQLGKDGVNWYGWEALAATRGATLPAGGGVKTIYVRFRDRAGNVSGMVSDSILLQ